MKRYTIEELRQGYASKEFSPVEITQQYVDMIQRNNSMYNAYITVTAELALQQAKMLEQKMMAGNELGKLFGIPLSYKDNIAIKGIHTTNGSYIDRDHIPHQNALVVQSLLSEDTITLGKNNLDEYALGITSNNPHYGSVKNPWDIERSPGGSSGGSAAAVGANLCVASIGTDTGGSVRIPAASCGVVGLKPTYNRVPLEGVTYISWTLDHVGPLASNMSDLAIIMEALTKQSYTKYCVEDIRGMRIGVPTRNFMEPIDTESYEIFKNSVKNLESLGAIIIEVDFPFLKGYQDIGMAITLSETSYVHKENISKSMSQYGINLQKIMKSIGSFSALDYITALKKREEYKRRFDDLFEHIDVLATPVLPTTPQKIGTETVKFGEITVSLSWLKQYTFIFNLIGNPALSVPCGITKESLPVGLQLIAANHREELLIRTGYAFEQSQLGAFYKKRDEICMM